jgi:small-conductance mechanosensitive channel
MQIPLSSTLAFGGIGGLAFGLASKDVISNFFGGI